MRRKKEEKKKKRFDIKKIRVYVLILIIMLIGLMINKKFFLMSLFIILTFVGNIIRGQFGNSMIMFDPLVFFSIILMKFWGFSSLLLFLFLTVFLADVLANHITDGSILNYFLFHICPFIGISLFGRLPMVVYGNFTAIFYSFVYFTIRTKLMGGNPIETAVKAITNVLFVFLYIGFFGPIFEVLM